MRLPNGGVKAGVGVRTRMWVPVCLSASTKLLTPCSRRTVPVRSYQVSDGQPVRVGRVIGRPKERIQTKLIVMRRVFSTGLEVGDSSTAAADAEEVDTAFESEFLGDKFLLWVVTVSHWVACRGVACCRHCRGRREGPQVHPVEIGLNLLASLRHPVGKTSGESVPPVIPESGIPFKPCQVHCQHTLGDLRVAAEITHCDRLR